jgi:hypothetical protein
VTIATFPSSFPADRHGADFLECEAAGQFFRKKQSISTCLIPRSIVEAA